MKQSVIIIIVIVILAIIVLLDIFVPSFRENIGKAIGIELGIIIFVVLVFGLYKLFNTQQNTDYKPFIKFDNFFSKSDEKYLMNY